MTAIDYLGELGRKLNEAGKDKSAQGKIRYNQLSRRWWLVYNATHEGVESADLLRSLTENLIYDWALPDDKVKTFKEALSVVCQDAKDDNSDDTVAHRWSRRRDLVDMAIKDGVKSVRQLQNLLENLTHQWMLPDDKVKTFQEALRVEWDDADAVKDTSKQDEIILTNRLSRRWSRRRDLVDIAIIDGVDSVGDLQHLLLHLTRNWKLSDSNVKTFKEAACVEWRDAKDLNDSSTHQLSQRWSDIYSKFREECSSVKKLQQELNLETIDDKDGSYDDYIVDATSLSGMSKKSIVASKSSHQPVHKPGIRIIPIISYSNLKTKDMNKNQSEMANAIEKQKKALQEGQKFNKEFMVYFDSQKAEGPYNDVYMFCFIKHGVITLDTLIAEKGKTSTMRAGDCKELEDFFSLFESENKEGLSDDIQEVAEESGLGDNIPKSLLKLYYDNEDLFEEADGADEALQNIQKLSIGERNGELFFTIDDLEGYLKEDLTDSQNAVVKTMVKETYRFLLHTKYVHLPSELIDLALDVTELFDDPYTHIDYRILSAASKAHHTYKEITNEKEEKDEWVDDQVEYLKDMVVDDVTPTPDQEKKIRQISEIMYDYIYS